MSKQQWIEENLKPGEQYAGLLLGKDGAPDQHIILLPGVAGNVSWEKAKEFAEKAGGELPTRREQSLLFANLKEQFGSNWYWSSEQHATSSGFAWMQDFSSGSQNDTLKYDEFAARAGRRLAI